MIENKDQFINLEITPPAIVTNQEKHQVFSKHNVTDHLQPKRAYLKFNTQ